MNTDARWYKSERLYQNRTTSVAELLWRPTWSNRVTLWLVEKLNDWTVSELKFQVSSKHLRNPTPTQRLYITWDLKYHTLYTFLRTHIGIKMFVKNFSFILAVKIFWWRVIRPRKIEKHLETSVSTNLKTYMIKLQFLNVYLHFSKLIIHSGKISGENNTMGTCYAHAKYFVRIFRFLKYFVCI